MESTQAAQEIVRQTTYLHDANIIGYLAVFGLINIPIWLIKLGMIFEKFRARKGKGSNVYSK